jgi:hypothetical protein
VVEPLREALDALVGRGAVAAGGAAVARDDPDPKALACYGLLARLREEGEQPREEVWLPFADGRPVSELTTRFPGWCCEQLQERGKRALLLVWDNRGGWCALLPRGA